MSSRSSRAGRRPDDIPPYKGNEKPSEPSYDPQVNGGWIALPFRQFTELIRGGRVFNFAQMLFILEIMKEQWGPPREKGTPVRDWTQPDTDEKWAARVGCGLRQFLRIKRDALERELIEARRDGRSLRYHVLITKWRSAPQAPSDLQTYEGGERGNNSPHGELFWKSPPTVEPGADLAVPVFPCRKIQNGLGFSVSVSAERGSLRFAAAEESCEANALCSEVQNFLAPFFVERHFAVDVHLARAIADVIVRLDATLDEYRDFMRPKLATDYWQPGLVLKGYTREDFPVYVRQLRQHSNGGANGSAKAPTGLMDSLASIARNGR